MSIKSNKKAFSIIELSIVILIVGVIIAGIVKTSAIYNKYKIKTAASITNSSPVNSIDGLVAWYETSLDSSFEDEEAQNFDDLTSAEKTLGMGYIQTWKDNSANGEAKQNATQSTLANRPSYRHDCIRGLPCLRFDGTDDHLDIPSAVNLDGDEYTIFVVDKKDSSGTEPYLFLGPDSASSDDDAIALGYQSSSTFLFSHGSTTNYYTITDSDDDLPRFHVFVGAFNNSLLSVYVSHSNIIDSGYSTLVDNGTPAFTSISGSAAFRIGSGYNGITETFFKGNIAEIIIFDRALKADERESVEEYLKDKYNAPNA